MQSQSSIQIEGYFHFTLSGLEITYSYKGQTTHLVLCPKATCQLLQDAGLIEGFDVDQNGEPVILFTDNRYPEGYGFDRWNAFVCTFRISYQMAVKLMEFRESRKESLEFQDIVHSLLQPLSAA